MTSAKTNEDNDGFSAVQELSLKDLHEQINHLEDGVILLISLSEQENSVWT